MDTSSHPCTATGAPSALSPDLDQWRRDVSDMDTLAQSGFDRIRALARLSMAAINPHTTRLEDVANVLQVIEYLCGTHADGVHALALPMTEGDQQ